MSIRQHIPNTLTSFNVLSGSIGITLAFNGQLTWAAFCIGIAAIFDFLDGFSARLLKAYSPEGKELDSLADVISFGLLPSVIIFQILSKSLESTSLPSYSAYIAFLITVASALRLARFNIDERQHTSFIGLPTPANAILLGSFPLILATDGTISTLLTPLITNPYILFVVILIQSYLLNAPVALFSLKLKNIKWADNKYPFTLLILSLILLLLFNYTAAPLIIVCYLILSMIKNIFSKKI